MFKNYLRIRATTHDVKLKVYLCVRFCVVVHVCARVCVHIHAEDRSGSSEAHGGPVCPGCAVQPVRPGPEARPAGAGLCVHPDDGGLCVPSLEAFRAPHGLPEALREGSVVLPAHRACAPF